MLSLVCAGTAGASLQLVLVAGSSSRGICQEVILEDFLKLALRRAAWIGDFLELALRRAVWMRKQQWLVWLAVLSLRLWSVGFHVVCRPHVQQFGLVVMTQTSCCWERKQIPLLRARASSAADFVSASHQTRFDTRLMTRRPVYCRKLREREVGHEPRIEPCRSDLCNVSLQLVIGSLSELGEPSWTWTQTGIQAWMYRIHIYLVLDKSTQNTYIEIFQKKGSKSH